ncbi:MAG: GTPase domain-containing protein [Planctomycetaceae bacterium]|jgi:hypothetical protein|nr:GTPase domain-containing protein [Planctomycetaceae bacterium]
MSSSLVECAASLAGLRRDVDALSERLEKLGIPRPEGSEWYELLIRKLIPQLGSDNPLIVAVVGGTNTGKSVVFNHIAGDTASGTSPLASGTKHPLCLIPMEFDPDRLGKTFEDFDIRRWSRSDDTLQDCQDHRLFWRHCDSLPHNLLVLDSPDIDSDAVVNWERAEKLRQTADVLIAVLTQQKYNDAAVKRFFQRAATEDLAVVVVFNQCQLPDDESFWPSWLATFVAETGTAPEFVYVAPLDRDAANSLKLTFRTRPLEADDPPRDLQQDLSRLRFDAIKFRSLRGSLRVSIETGLPAWLESIRQRSEEFRSLAELLSAEQLTAIDDWPTVPARPLIEAVRGWWGEQRSGWSSGIHSFYNAIGRGLAWPLHRLKRSAGGPPGDPLATYRENEWSKMLSAMEQVYHRLAWCRDAGGELLGPRLAPLLEGRARQEALQQLREVHDSCDLVSELDNTVAFALERFREENPGKFRLLRRIDRLAAVARPATSVALFIAGFGPVGQAVAPVVTDAALQSVLHVAGDVAGGTVVATLGESALSHSTATGVGYLESRFRNLQDCFAIRRATWLAQQLQRFVLGDLASQLQHAADTPACDEFNRVQATAGSLSNTLADLDNSPAGLHPMSKAP